MHEIRPRLTVRLGFGWIALLLAVSGCVSQAATERKSSPGTTTAIPVGTLTIESESSSSDADHARGSIAGVVTDEELRPLANATLQLQATAGSVHTATNGSFRIQSVPVGHQILLVAAFAYESVARGVEVRAGETVAVNVALAAVPVRDPHVIVVPHTLFIAYGGGGYYGQNALPCGADCNWKVNLTGAPDVVIFEFAGGHAVHSPLAPDGLTVAIDKQGGSGDVWFCPGIPIYDTYDGQQCRLPIKVRFNATDLTAAAPAGKPATQLTTRISCEYGWFCLQDKYESWASLFYDYSDIVIPNNYTARPVG